MSFWIVTDACCDLSSSYVNQQSCLSVLPLSYQMGGISYLSDGDEGKTVSFYQKMRDGGVSTTSQINEETWKEHLQPILEMGHDILCVVFSSGLSGTYFAGTQAIKALSPLYPARQIYAVDSLCASLGEGLMVDYAIKLRDHDKLPIKEAADWLEKNKLHFAQWFTVDDLVYLKRGGRVSAASAFIGGALNIKPILHVDNNGKLVPVSKVQGRKHSLRTLVEKIRETATDIENQTVFVSHGDCEDDAVWVSSLIKAELHVKDVFISMIGPVIGSHSGPGTIAIFWFASAR